MHNLARGLVITAAALLSTACATITRGSTEAWTVETDPSGATVRTSAGYACEATPCTWKLPRKTAFEVTISKPGYKTVQTQVVTTISTAGGAGMAGNVILGGLIGATVDLTTGAMKDLKPNPLTVKLEPVAPK